MKKHLQLAVMTQGFWMPWIRFPKLFDPMGTFDIPTQDGVRNHKMAGVGGGATLKMACAGGGATHTHMQRKPKCRRHEGSLKNTDKEERENKSYTIICLLLSLPQSIL